MKPDIKNIIFFILLVLGINTTSICVADDSPMDKADEAVANILFDYEYSKEYASYSVKDDGFVDVTFAQNTPDELYSEILNQLNNHPDIKGILAGKTGAYCARF